MPKSVKCPGCDVPVGQRTYGLGGTLHVQDGDTFTFKDNTHTVKMYVPPERIECNAPTPQPRQYYTINVSDLELQYNGDIDLGALVRERIKADRAPSLRSQDSRPLS